MVTNIMLALFLLLLLTGIYKYYIHTALPVDEKTHPRISIPIQSFWFANLQNHTSRQLSWKSVEGIKIFFMWFIYDTKLSFIKYIYPFSMNFYYFSRHQDKTRTAYRSWILEWSIKTIKWDRFLFLPSLLLLLKI